MTSAPQAIMETFPLELACPVLMIVINAIQTSSALLAILPITSDNFYLTDVFQKLDILMMEPIQLLLKLVIALV